MTRLNNTLALLRHRLHNLPLREMPRSNVGMTLIEIMIVVTIMASIMGVVGFYLLGASDRANIKLATAELGTLKQGINNYALDHNNRFPKDLNALVDGSIPYIEELKPDPWGNDYVYTVSGNRSATLRSAGPDGSPNTDDDIVVNVGVGNR